MNSSSLVTLLLVLLFPVQFLIQVLPYYGLEILSSVFVMTRFGLTIFLLIKGSLKKELIITHSVKVMMGLYFLYFLFVISQIFVCPYVNRIDMADVPESNSMFFINLIQQTAMIIVFGGYSHCIRYDLFAKTSSLLTVSCIFLYFHAVDFRIYGALDISDRQDADEFGFNIIGVFSLSAYIAYGITASISLFGKWSNNKFIDKSISYTITAISFISLLLIMKRGPILSILVTLLIYYFAIHRNRFSIRQVMYVLVSILIIMCIIQYYIIPNMGGLVSKVNDMLEGNSSGRFGTSDSVYSCSLRQIADGLLFGSYFRLLDSTWYGTYPHNIVLELFMTMGIFLSIPFLIQLWKSLCISYRFLTEQIGPVSIMLLYIHTFFCLMFSSSLIFTTGFWIPLFIIISEYNKTKNYEI